MERIFIMNPPKDVITSLTHDSLFSDWKKQHENTFMTHFFCSLSPDFVPKTTWEIGFYNKDSKKIVVFVELEKGFEIKPEDDVFSKETDTIEELYEPYLMQLGFLHRTPRGRIATADAYRHLGLNPPETLI